MFSEGIQNVPSNRGKSLRYIEELLGRVIQVGSGCGQIRVPTGKVDRRKRPGLGFSISIVGG